MSLKIDSLSRAVAARLAEHYGPELIPFTESALVQGNENVKKSYGTDPNLLINLANLVVAAASLVWAIYTDGKKDSDKVILDESLQRACNEMDIAPGISDEDRDRIVKAVVQELIDHKHGD